jgi:hypothetical protein
MHRDEQFSVEGAREAAERGELRAWVTSFLASPGSDNAMLAAELCERLDHWVGPVQLPLSRMQRLAGPPEDPVLQPVDEDFWDGRVDDMTERIDDDWEPAPVIVSSRNGELALEDGNHRLESLRRAGREEAWAVVGFENQADRVAFEEIYGRANGGHRGRAAGPD